MPACRWLLRTLKGLQAIGAETILEARAQFFPHTLLEFHLHAPASLERGATLERIPARLADAIRPALRIDKLRDSSNDTHNCLVATLRRLLQRLLEALRSQEPFFSIQLVWCL